MSYLDPPRPDPKGNPLVEHVKDQYVTGQMDRSQFLRYSTLLGMSLTAASAFVAAVEGRAAAAVNRPAGRVASGAPQRGGTLRYATEIIAVDHPHRLSWIQSSNMLRQVNEYLTLTDGKGVTHPYLLEKWQPNRNATVWTLFLRKGIRFTNGAELTADDAFWNFKSWLDPNTGSSMLGLLGPFLDLSGVEKVDKYTIRLHLKQATIAIPEFLYHYPAQILQKNWEPPDLKKGESLVGRVIGTGPFILKEFTVGSRARVVRNPNYWQKAPDGKPLPYLDGIVWTDLGSELAPYQAAVQAGQVDTEWFPPVDHYLFFRKNPNFVTERIGTISTSLFRMRVDQEPFTDKNVRNAFKALQARAAMGNIGYYGADDLGHDAHFGPADVDYVPKPIPKQDVDKTKSLLAGSSVWKAWGDKPITLTTKNDTRFEPVMVEIFKNAAKVAGITINLDIRPGSEFWPNWNNYQFGLTNWAHRPLNTMVNLLAYTRQALPTPQAPGNWNETRWVNDQFLKLLFQANATPDLQERKALISKMEDIQADDGGIGVAFFINGFNVYRNSVQNLPGHPNGYLLATETWIKR